MALTLEAALVVPLSLALVTGLTGSAQPVYRQARRTASLAVAAVIRQVEPAHLYQVSILSEGELTLPAVQSSPQRLIEWLQLVGENGDWLKRLVSPEATP